MFPSVSNAVERSSQKENNPANFSLLPEEIQQKIISYVNPVITRIFSQYVDAQLASRQIPEEVAFFAGQGSHCSDHKRLYFEYLKSSDVDVVACAQKMCDAIARKEGIIITPFEYFEAASGRRKSLSIDALMHLEAQSERALHEASAPRPSLLSEVWESAQFVGRFLFSGGQSFLEEKWDATSVYADLMREEAAAAKPVPDRSYLKEVWLLAIQNSYSFVETVLDYTLFPMSEADLSAALSRFSENNRLVWPLQKIPESVLIALWERIPMGYDSFEVALISPRTEIVNILTTLPKAILAEVLMAEALTEEGRKGLLYFSSVIRQNRMVAIREHSDIPMKLIWMTAFLSGLRKEYAALENLFNVEHAFLEAYKEYKAPLVFYTAFGYVEKVKALLIEQQHSDKILEKALREAVREGHADIVQILLLSRQTPLTQFAEEDLLFLAATSYGDAKVLALLLENAEFPGGRARLLHCLEFVADKGNMAIMELLLKVLKEEDPEGVDAVVFKSLCIQCTGRALQCAAGKGECEVMHLLLTTVWVTESAEGEALRCAAGMGQMEAVQGLLPRVCQMPKADYFIAGARKAAALKRHFAIVECLDRAVTQKNLGMPRLR